MLDLDVFLMKKIQELESALDSQCSDLYELIGSVRDLFSSPYISKPIVNSDLVKELWNVLTKIFIYDNAYDNKFDAILAMSDIYLYSRRQNINLCLNELKEWRGKHNENDTTHEILECIDDILFE